MKKRKFHVLYLIKKILYICFHVKAERGQSLVKTTNLYSTHLLHCKLSFWLDCYGQLMRNSIAQNELFSCSIQNWLSSKKQMRFIGSLLASPSHCIGVSNERFPWFLKSFIVNLLPNIPFVRNRTRKIYQKHNLE